MALSLVCLAVASPEHVNSMMQESISSLFPVSCMALLLTLGTEASVHGHCQTVRLRRTPSSTAFSLVPCDLKAKAPLFPRLRKPQGREKRLWQGRYPIRMFVLVKVSGSPRQDAIAMTASRVAVFACSISRSLNALGV
jgi:hypothetical protein